MTTPNLTFNILTFNHPEEEFAFYFYKDESDNLQRVHKTLVPEEVFEEFGEQEHYYTSFLIPLENGFPVTKKSKPVYITEITPEGQAVTVREKNTCFGRSVLKRFYNSLIHNHFTSLGHLVKPNFVTDTEVWIHSKYSNDTYNIYQRFSIKVQIARITKMPELLITYEGKSKAFRQSVQVLMNESDLAPEEFNWVIFKDQLFKYDAIPDEARRNLTQVFPVWNFDIRDTLQQKTEAPDRTNKYKKFHTQIVKFIEFYLNTDEFNSMIPLVSGQLEQVPEIKINTVKDHSNKLLFGNNHLDISPIRGIQKEGPLEIATSSQVHFFYIFHEDDLLKSRQLHTLFKSGTGNFKGLLDFVSIPYHAPKDFSIEFKDKDNPLPEIREQLSNRSFLTDIHYIAIYISPYSRDKCSKSQKKIYFQVKELLLQKDITSQAIDANKITNNSNYQYSLNNIAIAVLAKLNGVPWRLNSKLKNELIVGVGAFKHVDSDVRYIGSAFSFANNGKFNKFDCFHRNQTEELAGSILVAIKEYVSLCDNLQRLIIHYYKDMSDKEFDPIEKGLKNLGLDIPVFIISVNKTESQDIVAFDNNWLELMPMSGTIVGIGFNKFLLFNNTRYSPDYFRESEGYPFPIKIGISCNNEELAKETRVIRELIDQVYQFSRMYWKSVKQQNLPVTIKYPEMVAEIFPHFEGNEIPDFGKDNLWFL